jgi:hypothetical protein
VTAADTCRDLDRAAAERRLYNLPGPVYLDTVTLEDLDGSTLLRQNTVFQFVEDRDLYLTTGAEAGVRESMERLDTLLVELARRP